MPSCDEVSSASKQWYCVLRAILAPHRLEILPFSRDLQRNRTERRHLRPTNGSACLTVKKTHHRRFTAPHNQTVPEQILDVVN